jgi:hypothetical protein
MRSDIAAGYTFRHRHFLDPAWKPSAGERYRDAPKAMMIVTRVTATTVYFTYVGSTRGAWKLARQSFNDQYGETA